MKTFLSEAEVPMSAAVAARAPAIIYTAGNMFEGLFVRGLPPEPSFHADLKAVGVDVERLLPRYPIKVWLDAIAVARRHFFPGHTQQQADWQLGRLFTQGFLDTLIGRAVGAVLPMLGPARMLERSQRNISVGRPDIRVTIQVVGETERCLLFEDAEPLPDFGAGCTEAGLERGRAKAQVTVEDRQATSYVLRVRW
jgi:uncharacterized protein (TIGR02265 family)